MSDLSELPRWALDLLGSARVAHLGLVDLEGGPRVQPVTFSLHEATLWSAVDAKPKRAAAARLARLRFIAREPRVALTVDRYSEEWDRLAWVQVLAHATIVELDVDGGASEAAAAGLRSLIAKYPQYRRTPPGGPLIALKPARCLWWSAR